MRKSGERGLGEKVAPRRRRSKGEESYRGGLPEAKLEPEGSARLREATLIPYHGVGGVVQVHSCFDSPQASWAKSKNPPEAEI